MTQMKKYIIPSLMLAVASLTSCDSYLDINTNPNSPSEGSLDNDLIYPAVEMAYASNVGDYLRTCSGFLVQYYAQYFGTSNYIVFSQFQPTQARTSTFYSQLNLRVLSNAAIVKEKAAAEGDWATYLAATVMSAATYQTLIDMYGETPYTEALDSENAMPKYDTGEDVYAGILQEIDEAIAKVTDRNQATATSFLIPNGTADAWIKVANALKLRIMMREHNAVNVSSQLQALISENNFPASDVEWAGCWQNAAGKANPFYSEDFADWGSQKNTVLNAALAVTMNAYSDSRLRAYFVPSLYDGKFNGSISGTNVSTAASPYSSTAYWSRPNMAYDSPVSFISKAEIEFFLAEYYAENGNMATARQHYEDAIRASFASAGVPGADAAIAAYPFTDSRWKESLGVQKWVHLSGVNTFEGWCEARRLDYPEFDTTVSGSDMFSGATNCEVDVTPLSPGHLYTPYQVYSEVGNNRLAERFPYSTASENTNDNVPEFPGFTAPIFWAK